MSVFPQAHGKVAIKGNLVTAARHVVHQFRHAGTQFGQVTARQVFLGSDKQLTYAFRSVVLLFLIGFCRARIQNFVLDFRLVRHFRALRRRIAVQITQLTRALVDFPADTFQFRFQRVFPSGQARNVRLRHSRRKFLQSFKYLHVAVARNAIVPEQFCRPVRVFARNVHIATDNTHIVRNQFVPLRALQSFDIFAASCKQPDNKYRRAAHYGYATANKQWNLPRKTQRRTACDKHRRKRDKPPLRLERRLLYVGMSVGYFYFVKQLRCPFAVVGNCRRILCHVQFRIGNTLLCRLLLFRGRSKHDLPFDVVQTLFNVALSRI